MAWRIPADPSAPAAKYDRRLLSAQALWVAGLALANATEAGTFGGKVKCCPRTLPPASSRLGDCPTQFSAARLIERAAK